MTDLSLRALVATSRCLFEIDLESGERRVVDEGFGLYFGITWDAEHFYVAARWYPAFMPTSAIERPRLLVLDAELKVVERRPFELEAGGLHQILFHDGLLYCSCSRQDRYLVGFGDHFTPWYPSPNAAHQDRDTHHFNSVFIEGDRLFVLGHNNGPSDVWELTFPGRQLIRKHRAGRTAHNVWRESGGSLAICNSRGGQVETLGGRVLVETGGFPRGVASGSGVTLIGVSSLANRSNRWLTSGEVHVYDEDWKLRKKIDLGRCGQVNDIRLLGEDRCHNGLAPPSG